MPAGGHPNIGQVARPVVGVASDFAWNGRAVRMNWGRLTGVEGTGGNGVPVFRTALIGRDDDVAAVRALAGNKQLVTIIGAGGCGKTRLAAAVATDVAAAEPDGWPGGVWWIDLQSVGDGANVADVAVEATGTLVDGTAGALYSLVSQIGEARTLLVIDNCEQVVDAVADLVDALQSECPGVFVLATSRIPLEVAGERVWRLPVLDDAAAVELFTERAREARGTFTVGDEDGETRETLQRLCWGLDGIPLAIELAAAWTRTLTPRQIAAGLDDRFGLLVRSSRGAAARHETLKASIDWSYDLLSGPEAAMFRRLAAFAGPFSVEDAVAVAAVRGSSRPDSGRAENAGRARPTPPPLTPQAIVVLDGLVAKSLVVAGERDDGRTFRLLESLRIYAGERLVEVGELDAARDRHLDRLLAVAEEAEPLLDTDKDAWRAVVEPRLDDLRAALDWGLSLDDPSRGRRLAAATAWMWNLRGRGTEGVTVLRSAISRAADEPSPVQARLLTGYGMIGDTSAPDDLDPLQAGEELAAELGDDRLRGRCVTMRAVGSFYRDFDEGWKLCDQALALADAAGDQYGTDTALGLQGLILHLRNRHHEATELLAPVLDRMTRRGDRGIVSTLLVHESTAAWSAGDADRARELAERAVTVAEPLGDFHRVGTTRAHLALLDGLQGHPNRGLELLAPFARRVEGTDPGVFVPGLARTIGHLHLWLGDTDEALDWFAPGALASGPIDGSHLDALALPGTAAALRLAGRAEEAVAVLDRADEIVAQMDMPRVRAEVTEQRALLVAAIDPARVHDLHHEALAVRAEHGLRTEAIPSIEQIAHLKAASDRAGDAAHLLAAADAARTAVGYPRPPVDQPAHASTVDALRARLNPSELDEATTRGRALTLDEAIAYVRRARGGRGRPTAGWASLTPTELDVVRCVVDGMSNPQIAEKLLMSRGTVKAHLGHVYAKLSLSNRTELATFAASHLAPTNP